MQTKVTQSEKAESFYNLHHRRAPFIIPNPWDPGSARILQSKGFNALATTSVGVDHMNGKPSGTAGRDEMLTNAKWIVDATELPLSIDLEDCYGATPEAIRETINLAAATGAVGCSIEDLRFGSDGEIYPIEESVARVKAAVEAAKALPFKFTLTARSENFLVGNPDLEDTIKRLKAYGEVGADVLYAPGISTPEQVDQIVKTVGKPINVLLGLGGTKMTLDDMKAAGVARVSLGSALHRASMTAALSAIDEIQEAGTFKFTAGLTGMGEIDKMLS